MTCRATQDGQVMVESSDKMWFTGEGNGKPLQYSCLENPMNSMKKGPHVQAKRQTPTHGVAWQFCSGQNKADIRRGGGGGEAVP